MSLFILSLSTLATPLWGGLLGEACDRLPVATEQSEVNRPFGNPTHNPGFIYCSAGQNTMKK